MVRPLPFPTGDPRVSDVLYNGLGQALARWQYIETGMFLIAHVLMATSYKASSIAFFHIRSAESKLQLIDKLACAILDQTTLKREWKPLRKDIDDAIDFRNALAHFEVSWIDPARVQGTAFPIALSAHHLDHHAVRGGAVKALFIENLWQAAREYLDLAKRIMRFSANHLPDFERHIALLPPHLQQALETIRNESSPAGPLPPPGSSLP